MDLPFTPSGKDLTDEAYAALDRYYCRPRYDRDPSELHALKEQGCFFKEDNLLDAKEKSEE